MMEIFIRAVSEEDFSSEALPIMEEGDIVPMLTPERINKRQNGRRFKQPGDAAFTISTIDRNGFVTQRNGELIIRSFTEREALRLMGQSDDAIDRLFEVESSRSARYRLAGNSIVVDVLEAVFKGIYVDSTFKPRSRPLEDFR